MSRGLLGAGLGASAATVYLRPDILQDAARNVLFPSRTSTYNLEAAGSSDLAHLQHLVSGVLCVIPSLATSATAPHRPTARPPSPAAD